MRRSPLRALALTLTLLLGVTTAAWADNESNQTDGGPYVVQLASDPGTVTLEFHADGAICASFELLGVERQTNKDVGSHQAVCGGSDVSTTTYIASTVSVRLVNTWAADGATTDQWNFDWTDFHAPADEPAQPTSKDDCKNGGWESHGFANQGQCVKYVNTGQDSRS